MVISINVDKHGETLIDQLISIQPSWCFELFSNPLDGSTTGHMFSQPNWSSQVHTNFLINIKQNPFRSIHHFPYTNHRMDSAWFFITEVKEDQKGGLRKATGSHTANCRMKRSNLGFLGVYDCLCLESEGKGWELRWFEAIESGDSSKKSCFGHGQYFAYGLCPRKVRYWHRGLNRPRTIHEMPQGTSKHACLGVYKQQISNLNSHDLRCPWV